MYVLAKTQIPACLVVHTAAFQVAFTSQALPDSPECRKHACPTKEPRAAGSSTGVGVCDSLLLSGIMGSHGNHASFQVPALKLQTRDQG